MILYSSQSIKAAVAVFLVVVTSTTIHFHQRVFGPPLDEFVLYNNNNNNSMPRWDNIDLDAPANPIQRLPKTPHQQQQGRQLPVSKKQRQDSTLSPSTMTVTTRNTPIPSDTLPISMTTTIPHETLQDILDIIIQTRQLHDCPRAKTLLRRLWDKDNRYDASQDLIVFYHPLKTGGTSVSDVLEQLGGVVPGSGRSNNFSFRRHKYEKERELQQLLFQHRIQHTNSTFTVREWWSTKRVLFSHNPYTSYQPQPQSQNQNQNTTGIYNLLHTEARGIKRIRHITMIREPMAFVASNWHEWYCRIAKWANVASQQKRPKRKDYKTATDYYGCHGYTLENLTQARITANQKECFLSENGTWVAKPLQGMARERKHVCKKVQKGQFDDMPECVTVASFLESPNYQTMFHNHGTYAKCTTPTTITTTTSDSTSSNNMVEWIQGALEFLGGIDRPTTATTTIDDDDMGGDMMWVGVTERMHESMCLLHYQLQLPWVDTPRERMQNCRPTNYWTPSDRTTFYEKEPLMVSVHRAANAVLDLQLAKMRYEVQQQLQILQHQHPTVNQTTLLMEYMPNVPKSCLVDSSLGSTTASNKK